MAEARQVTIQGDLNKNVFPRSSVETSKEVVLFCACGIRAEAFVSIIFGQMISYEVASNWVHTEDPRNDHYPSVDVILNVS